MQSSIRPTPDYAKLRAAALRAPEALSLHHHRVELFFNGFSRTPTRRGDACNDLRLLLLDNHPALCFRQHQKAVCGLEQDLTVPIFPAIHPAETRDASRMHSSCGWAEQMNLRTPISVIPTSHLPGAPREIPAPAFPRSCCSPAAMGRPAAAPSVGMRSLSFLSTSNSKAMKLRVVTGQQAACERRGLDINARAHASMLSVGTRPKPFSTVNEGVVFPGPAAPRVGICDNPRAGPELLEPSPRAGGRNSLALGGLLGRIGSVSPL